MNDQGLNSMQSFAFADDAAEDRPPSTNYFNETETDEVSRDGLSYEGVNKTKIYSLTGTLLLEIDGTAKATRIEP